MTVMRTAGTAIRMAAIPAAAAALVLLSGTACAADEAAEALKQPKAKVADACEKHVKALVQTRCFFTLREYIKIGLWFDPGHEKLRKYQEFYAFVPELQIWFSEIRPENLPESRDLRKSKHDRKADARALLAFFGSDLDNLLCFYMDELTTIKGYEKEIFKEHAGKDVLALEDFLHGQSWIGYSPRTYVQILQFQNKMEAFLTYLGFKKIKYTDMPSERAHWVSPREARAFESREKVEAEWKSFLAKRTGIASEKFACLQKEVETELIEEKSEFEKAFDIKMWKMRSKHFRIEAPILDTTVKAALALQESVFARLLIALKVDDPGRFDPPVRTAVLASQDLFKKYMAEMKAGTKEENIARAEKEFHAYDSDRKCFVSALETYDAFMRDNLAYGVIDPVLERLGFGQAPFWLRFGLNMHVTMDLLGTADSATIRAPKDADYVESWLRRNYYNWKQIMKDQEKEGTAPPLRDVLLRKSREETSVLEGIKIHCLFQALVIQEPDRMRAIAAAAAKEGWIAGPDGEFGALKTAGWTVADLEKAYQKHVTR